MAQFINQPTDLNDQDGEKRYEIVMVATGKDGEVVTDINPLPVTLGSENITITGSVNIGSTVEVISSPEEPVHTHISEVGTSGILDIPNMPVSIQDADGNENSSTYPVYTNVVNLPDLQTVAFQAGTADAFGRLRVSEPYTLADYSHTYGEEAELLTKKSGVQSTALSRANEAAIRLTVGTGATDYVIHQSRMHHHYMPGKSQMTLMSFNFGQHRANTVKRIGLYGEENGVYLQQAGDGTLSFVMRSSVTGSVIDATPVQQLDWNVDTCNGDGPSGFNIIENKVQLLYIDYQWLGVGRVRIGFVHEGQFIVAHEFYHSNIISTVYWSNPSLPIRCEIRNTDVAVGTSYMDQMCATVVSEGGYKESGVNFSKYSDAITLVKGAPAAAKCLMAIKLKDNYQSLPNRSIVRISDLNLISDSATIVYELWRLPNEASITGGAWVDAGTSSVVEYNITAGTGFTTTDGELFASGFLPANNASGKQATGGIEITDPAQAKRAYISQNIDSNDSNVFALIARNLSSNTDTTAFASMQWRETR